MFVGGINCVDNVRIVDLDNVRKWGEDDSLEYVFMNTMMAESFRQFLLHYRILQ